MVQQGDFTAERVVRKSAFSNLGSTLAGGISGNASNLMGQLVGKGMLTPEQAQKIGRIAQ